MASGYLCVLVKGSSNIIGMIILARFSRAEMAKTSSSADCLASYRRVGGAWSATVTDF